MKYSKKIGLGLLFLGIIFASAFFIKSNSKPLVEYETTQLTIATIENKIVATGKVIPEDEVEIKPQIAGIIEKILVKEGDEVITQSFTFVATVEAIIESRGTPVITEVDDTLNMDPLDLEKKINLL